MPPKVATPYLLTVEDIVDWAGLRDRLRENSSNVPGLSERIMSHLPPSLREPLSTGAVVNEDFKSDFVRALNEILQTGDLIQPKDFESAQISGDTLTRLSRDEAMRSAEDLTRLNRLLLETAFPQEIRQRVSEPYVGPRSFEKSQRGFFFGRDEEADELVALVTAHPAVLVYSQSGAGKSSLLKAKLIPKLEEEEQFNVLPPMRVQGQIPAGYKVPKNTNIFWLNALASCGKFDNSRSKNGDLNLCEFLKEGEHQVNQYGEPCPTVLVFDQFEEMFTSYPGRWADRQSFFEQIGYALDGNPKEGTVGDPLLRVVFCMREDYIAELDPYLGLLPERLRTRFRLEHLRGEKALLAITKPLERTNRTFAKGVPEQLVKNLLKLPSQGITGAHTLGLYVEPVQLQVVWTLPTLSRRRKLSCSWHLGITVTERSPTISTNLDPQDR